MQQCMSSRMSATDLCNRVCPVDCEPRLCVARQRVEYCPNVSGVCTDCSLNMTLTAIAFVNRQMAVVTTNNDSVRRITDAGTDHFWQRADDY